MLKKVLSNSEIICSSAQEKTFFLNNEQEDSSGSKPGMIVLVPKKISNEIAVELAVLKNEAEKSKKGSHREKGWKQYIGLLLAVLSSLFFSFVFVLVKVLHEYHPFSLSAWRQLGNVIPSIFLVVYFRCWRKQNIFEQVWPLDTKENKSNVIGIALRGFLGATSVILKFYALDFLSIGDANVIAYTSPIFVIILAYFVLHEKIGIVAIVTGIWTLLGVGLITRPPFLTGKEADMKILIGTGVVIIAVIFQSGVSVLVRKIRKIHFSVMTLAFGTWGFVQSSLVSVAFGVFTVPVGWQDIGLTALLAFLSFMGQICAIMSLKFEEAGPVSLIRATDILFAFLWQMVFLNDFPDLFSVLGACIVTSGVFVTAFRKWVSTLPEENPTRQNLKCILK